MEKVIAWNKNERVWILLITGLIIALVLWVTVLLINQVRVRKNYSELEMMLSHFLESGEITGKDSKETRESKIISQMRQILKMAEGRRRETEGEKEVVTRLISDLSHQLKTPLANIQIYSELLKDDELTIAEKSEFMERIKEQARKMEWLMKALLKTSRLETGIIQFDTESKYIKETIKESISAILGQAESKKIKIVLDDFEDLRMKHNRKWTAEAITNILENAIKYSGSGTNIHISFTKMELYAKISIRDEGIGIPKEEFNQIFQRFYRGEQVQEEQGTGLGLYLARLILSKEDGYITVDSAKGAGSCFSVFLLRAREEY